MRRLGGVYENVRRSITELVGDLNGKASSTMVPACPGWSVHDVVAHISGNCSDVLSGNVVGAATDEWTAAQVEKRRDWALTDVLTEWGETGPQIAAMLDDFPGWYGRQMVADVTAHEHDLRGALGRRGDHGTEAVAIGLDFLVNVMLRSAMAEGGLGPLKVEAAENSWVVGTGDPPIRDADSWRTAVGSMDPLPAPPPEVGILVAEPFELFRAISGRRSAAQIRSFEWTVDPDPYLAAFSYGPFKIRDLELVE